MNTLHTLGVIILLSFIVGCSGGDNNGEDNMPGGGTLHAPTPIPTPIPIGLISETGPDNVEFSINDREIYSADSYNFVRKRQTNYTLDATPQGINALIS